VYRQLKKRKRGTEVWGKKDIRTKENGIGKEKEGKPAKRGANQRGNFKWGTVGQGVGEEGQRFPRKRVDSGKRICPQGKPRRDL